MKPIPPTPKKNHHKKIIMPSLCIRLYFAFKRLKEVTQFFSSPCPPLLSENFCTKLELSKPNMRSTAYLHEGNVYIDVEEKDCIDK